MFFRPLHIVFITLAALLLSYQKASAVNTLVSVDPNHILSEHVSSPSIRLAKQIIVDSLTDSNEDNGDDETSSKSKHKLPKPVITSPAKFHALCMAVMLLQFDFNLSAFLSTDKRSASVFLFGKTPISIAIRCLRI